MPERSRTGQEGVRRLTLDLDANDHRALRITAVEQDIPMADILRALVGLWRRDKDVRRRTDALLAGEVSLGKPIRH